MNELQPGQCAYIQAVEGEGALRHHLLDMGLTPGTEITLQKIAPMGDPVQIKVRGYELTPVSYTHLTLPTILRV